MDTVAIIDKLIEKLVKFAAGIVALFLIVVLTTATWLRYDLDPAVEPLTRTELVGAIFFWTMIVVPGVAIIQFLWRRRARIAKTATGIWVGIRRRCVAIVNARADERHRPRQSKGIGKDEPQH